MSAEQANACGADGCNALMLAAQNGHAEVVRLLLADTRTAQQVFKSDLRGNNALVHATLAGSVAAVEALLGDSSALAQAVAISQVTFNGMVNDVLKDGVEKLFTRAGVPMARPGATRATGTKRYTLKEVTSYCPPRVVLTLLPIIARKLAKKRSD
jgi:ankyrin repeat protein